MKLFLLLALALALTTPAHGPKLRRFTVTAYCHCSPICTRRGDGITASGVHVREGITIAAPRSIPFGTRIWVPGAGWRTVQDRLSRRYDHRLDLYFTSHKRALQWGIQHSNLHNPTDHPHSQTLSRRAQGPLTRRPGAPPHPAPLPLPRLQPPQPSQP
jgi:3D (Asp-Asp-Asp) domain-containing protein